MRRGIKKRSVKIMYNMKEMVYVNKYRVFFVKLVTYGAIVLFIVTISFSPHLWKNNTEINVQPYKKFPTDLKYILFWKAKEKIDNSKVNFINEFSKKRKEKFAQGQTLFIKQNCPVYNCYITYDAKFLGHEWYFDAIVFDIHAVRHKKIQDFRLMRQPYQKYIFRSMESSDDHYMCSKRFDNFFNLTWTFKLDSDIPHPFFNVYDLKNNILGPKLNMKWVHNMKRNDRFLSKVKSKKKAVAWYINNCAIKNQYNDFFESLRHELSRYNLTVDSIGSCGNKSCGDVSYKCYKKIEKEYFFQLVTEEATDKDFVTEQLARVMQHVMIPIVVGNIDYQNFLPPGSYINAHTFDMKKVVAIIDYLIKNKETFYTYFFDWKNHYIYNMRPKNYVCDLCAALNKQNDGTNTKPELRKWWNPDFENICLANRLYYKFSKNSSSNDSTL